MEPDQSALFFNLVMVLGSATVVASVFHLMRLPPMVGFLVAGVLVGPNGFKFVSSIGEVEVLAEIAAVLLLFTLGLEFSWKTVLSLRKLLINLGLFQVLLTAIVVATGARWIWDLTWAQGIFAGVLVAMSSTAAVLKLLHDQRHIETPFGKACLGILLSQDLVVMIILLLLPLLSETGATAWASLSWWQVGEFFSRGAIVIGILVLGTRYFVPLFLDLVSHTKSREVFFFAIIFLCASIAMLMQHLGLSLSLGAFCAGVMVSESPYGRQTISDFTPLRNNFLGIFFVAIGMLLNLQYVQENWLMVASVLTAVIIIKAFLIMGIMWVLGNPATIAVATGLILAQIGEFSFILLDTGRKIGLVDEGGRQLVLAIAIGSLALTPFLYRLALAAAFRVDYDHIVPKQLKNLALELRKSLVRHPMQVRVEETDLKLSALEKLENHTLLIGFGIAAQNLASTFRDLKLPYRVLEMNHTTVKTYAAREPIFFGDATQTETLKALHVESAQLVVIAVTGAEISGAIHRTVRQLNDRVPVIVRTQYLKDLNQIEDHGRTDIVIAEFEGTLALISRAMTAYGLGEDALQEFLRQARRRLNQEHRKSRSAAPQ